MHELVLVLSDFHISHEAADGGLPLDVALPGLQHVARFGTRSKLSSGWRPWVSRWLMGTDAGATATVAAAQMGVAPGAVAWMATPMHLIAGMTSVHVDRRSILRLDSGDQQTLAVDFQRVFHDSGFRLQPLAAGDFLMLGPEMPTADATRHRPSDRHSAPAEDPARALGGSMGQHAHSSLALRRLGAEIEMWLHDHPLNDARRRRGELPVTSLWLWGAGPAFANDDVGATVKTAAVPTSGAADGTLAFGRDSYLHGLWALCGGKIAQLPQQLADVFSYSHAQRAVLVIEIGVMLQSNPKWTLLEAVADIDRRWVAPAVEALNRGQFQRLVVLANDYELKLRARDRLKFWRRAPPGLSGLQ